MTAVTTSASGFWSAVDWERINIRGRFHVRGPGVAGRGWLIGSAACGSLPALGVPFVHYENPIRRWLAVGRAMARQHGLRLVERGGYLAFDDELELVVLDGGKPPPLARGTR
jgi:hypothetical protein